MNNLKEEFKTLIDYSDTQEEIESIMDPIKNIVEMLEPEIDARNYLPYNLSQEYKKQQDILEQYCIFLDECQKKINLIIE